MAQPHNLRKNPLDTDAEIKAEIQESLQSIIADVDGITLSLKPQDLKIIIEDLEEVEIKQVLHRLFDLAPADVKSFATAVEESAGENIDILKEITYSVAENGLMPEKYLDSDIVKILFNEVYENDPQLIQDLNKVERISDVLGLRYRLQELLMGTYLAKYPHLEAFEFDDLSTSAAEDELERESEYARADTSSKFADYKIEYKLGKERDYEVEEMIFLAKKVIYIAKSEGQEIPANLESELAAYCREYNQKSYKVQDVNVDSTDYFSFHQVKLLGSEYNFGYFRQNASQNDFFGLPQLNEQPVMVLLHGMSRDWAFWRKMIKEILPYYQIIIPDMNGYGDSAELVEAHTLENYSRYVADFLKRLNVKEFDIMGHSLGSFTAQQVLANQNLHPRKGVLFSSAPYIELPIITSLLGDFTKSFTTSLVGKIMANVPPQLENLTSKQDQQMIDEDNYYARVIAKASPRAISEALKYIAFDYHFENYVKQSDQKYLIVAAEDDRIIPANLTQKFLDYFPKSEFVMMPGIGHDEVVNRFLDQHLDHLHTYLGIN